MTKDEQGISKLEIELANSVFWCPKEDDKVHLKNVYVAISNFEFTMRRVSVRFADGPALDFSVFDMDRLTVEYLKMRGVKLPLDVQKRTQAEPSPRCDFLVPSHLMQEAGEQESTPSKMIKKKSREKKQSNRKVCSRCHLSLEKSGDWFGSLCPNCADKTEGRWICHLCGSEGDFEGMGGGSGNDPVCCGSPCQRILLDAN